MHDETKVLLGSHGSSDLIASSISGDAATFPAGLVVRLASTGALSLSSGSPIGISLGRSLSDHSQVSIARSGTKIAIRLTNESGFAYVVKGAYVEFDNTGKAVSSGTASQAFYVSGPIKGIDPVTKAEIDVAIIDFPGGL